MYNLTKTLHTIRAAGWVINSVGSTGTIYVRGNGSTTLGRMELAQALRGWYKAADVKLLTGGVQP